MPIRIPNDLPAAEILQQENIFVMTHTRAITQDIRPLELVVLNLMPTKIATETQLTRLLGNTPLQVHLELMHTTSHESKNVTPEHLLQHHRPATGARYRNCVPGYADALLTILADNGVFVREDKVAVLVD